LLETRKAPHMASHRAFSVGSSTCAYLHQRCEGMGLCGATARRSQRIESWKMAVTAANQPAAMINPLRW